MQSNSVIKTTPVRRSLLYQAQRPIDIVYAYFGIVNGFNECALQI